MRPATVALLTSITCATISPAICPAQESRPTTSTGKPQQQQDAKHKQNLQAAKKALTNWLTSDRIHDDRLTEARLQTTLDILMRSGKPGLAHVAAELAAAEKARDGNRVAAIDSLVGHLGLRWLKKVKDSQMVYAGQYNDLRPLMPHIGEFYFRLLLDTPEWFSIDERWKVVPALRDLLPKSPGRVIRDRVEAMAKDLREPSYLRVRLSYAMAQWGVRSLIKDRIKALDKKTRSDDEESAVLALRDLASIYYDIRDYALAAVTNKEFLKRAEATDFPLVPVYYYNAACSMCLSGDRRSALDYLRRSLKLNESPNVDSSMRLKRDLYENDPEIALARSTKGFTEMLDEAFGPRKKEPKRKVR